MLSLSAHGEEGPGDEEPHVGYFAAPGAGPGKQVLGELDVCSSPLP